MSAHRVWTFAVLGCAGWLALLFYGCSSAEPPVYLPLPYPAEILVKHDLPNGEECHVNAWCKSGFCNAGICDQPGAQRRPNRALCYKDADCQSGYCDGRRCTHRDTNKLPNGKACSADAQCQMGLCDRGVCGRIVTWRYYGVPCVPVPSGTPLTELPEGADCFGYLCLDGRCRSCESDSDCTLAPPPARGTPWKQPLTCAKFNDWPGKQCGQVVPGQVCPNGNPPAPPRWPDEGPEIVSIAPAIPHPDGALPGPPKPEFDCHTWPDM